MFRKKRIYRKFLAAEATDLWSRWRNGNLMAEIAREIGHHMNSVRSRLMATGGFTPAEPKRGAQHLTDEDREHITRGLARGDSFRRIAAGIDRQPSTVSREVNRNGGRSGYRSVGAEARAIAQRARPKECKLAASPRLCKVVTDKLKELWSPEQIAGQLKLENTDPTMQVSHETIYKTLFIQSRGALRAELRGCLRTGRLIRHGRRAGGTHRRGQIPNAVAISERPASVEDRAVPGHWEGDLIVGSQRSYIVTLVERKTRFVLLAKVTSKETSVVIDALIRKMKQLPDELRKSLTLDRGAEFSQHARLTFATDLAVFFCDPRSPWQRGANENTNGLLRQYFPKGKDVSGYTQAQLDKVARSLNNRPRETLGFRTPAFMLNQALQ